jgi:hypothetical protein
MPDALDTLLLMLLVECGAAGLLEGLVCAADLAAPLRDAVACLSDANRCVPARAARSSCLDRAPGL